MSFLVSSPHKMLTDLQLRKIMPNVSASKRQAALPILNQVAKDYDISNERRMAAWLATLAVESGELRYQEEIASGAAYEGRKDLGNTQKGDGRRFKGHGRIQITGRANHQSYTNYLKRSGHLPFVDFTQQPTILATEPYATDSAGWFWAVFKKLNAPADRGDFLTTQIKVNGRNKRTGLPNHWKERNAYFLKGLSVLPDDFNLSAPPASATPPATDTPTLDDPIANKEAPTDILPTETVEITQTTTATGSEATSVTVKNEQDVNETVTVKSADYQGVGFIGALKKDFAVVGGGNLSFQSLQEYATQASGWPPWVISLITKLATIIAIVGAAWLIYRLVHYLVWKLTHSSEKKLEANIKSDVTRKNVEFE